MTDKVEIALQGTGPIPAPDVKGVKGKKKAPGKPKRAIEVEFKPNTYAPVLTIFPFRAPDVYHSFEFDGTGLLRMATDGAELVVNVSAQRYPSMYPVVDIVDGFTRLTHLALSKKLTYACPPSVGNMYYDDFKVVKNAEVQVPSFLKLLAEGFGTFVHDSVEYCPRNIPLHQFNHFAYATSVLGQNGVPGAHGVNFYVNNQMRNWSIQVRERSARLVDDWCKTPGNQIVSVVNGVNYAVSPPTPVGLAPFPATWNADVTAAGVAPPVDVAAHARLVANIDAVGYAQGVMPGAAALAMFGAANYWVLDWNVHTISSRLAHYQATTEIRFSGLWRTAFAMESMKTMDSKGDSWQLMSVGEETMTGMSAFSIPVAQQVTAYMMARNNPKVSIETDQFRIGVGEKTPRSARVEAIRRAAQSKEFV